MKPHHHLQPLRQAAAIAALMVLATGCPKQDEASKDLLDVCQDLVTKGAASSCEKASGPMFKDIPEAERVTFEIKYSGDLAFAVDLVRFDDVTNLEQFMERHKKVQADLVQMFVDKGQIRRSDASGLAYQLRFSKNLERKVLIAAQPGPQAEKASDKLVVVSAAVQAL